MLEIAADYLIAALLICFSAQIIAAMYFLKYAEGPGTALLYIVLSDGIGAAAFYIAFTYLPQVMTL